MLAVCAASCAWAAEVYSANTVGYTRVAVNPGFNLVGAQFVEVGTDSSAAINNLVVASADLPGINSSYTGFDTTLQVWTGLGYTTYGLLAVGQGEAVQMPDWDGKWLLSNMTGLADADLPTGNGFWIQTGNLHQSLQPYIVSSC